MLNFKSSMVQLVVAAAALSTFACSSESEGSSGVRGTRALTTGSSSSTLTENVLSAHKDVATAAIHTFASLGGKSQNFGLSSVEDVGKAHVADSLPIYHVGVGALSTYDVSQDPRSLLQDEQSVLCTVAVNGEERSTIKLRYRSGEWKPVAFGAPGLAKQIGENLRALGQASGASGAISLVEIPTLSASLLAAYHEQSLQLTLLRPIAGLTVPPGTTLPAAQLFAQLRPLADRANKATDR